MSVLLIRQITLLPVFLQLNHLMSCILFLPTFYSKYSYIFFLFFFITLSLPPPAPFFQFLFEPSPESVFIIMLVFCVEYISIPLFFDILLIVFLSLQSLSFSISSFLQISFLPISLYPLPPHFFYNFLNFGHSPTHLFCKSPTLQGF